MTRIGFIFPSSDYLLDPFRGDPFTHFQILTVLEQHFQDTIEPLLIDLRGIRKDWAFYHIPECDVYLHSVYTLDYTEQCSLVKMLREHYPQAKHIAGGPHANMFQAECLTVFDALILGEGEQTIIQAIDDFRQQKIQKIYFQSGPVDINAYSYWSRKYLPKSATARKHVMTLKNTPGYDQLWGTTALFSRGCPYHCHFCTIRHERENTPGIRFRTPENVKAEIQYLQHEYGIQGLALSDEICLPLNQATAIRHLEAIGSTGIIWRGQCRVDGITPELAQLASASGCKALGMGVESVVQQCLDIINKKTDLRQACETIAFLKKNAIEARVYLIIGLPGEPDNIVEQTWKFIEETDPDLVHLALFTVRPGTEVFNNPEKFGIIKIHTDWDNMLHNQGEGSGKRPKLTFEYAKEAPWGPSIPAEKIVDNYLELHERLRQRGLRSIDITKQLSHSLSET